MAPAWSFGPGLLELQLQLQQLLLPLLLIWSLLYLLQWWVSGFRGTDGGLRDQLRAWAHPEVSGDPADNRVVGVAFRGAGLPLLAVALADPESPEGSENIPATPAEPTPAEPTAAPADAEVVAFSSDEELNEFMWQNMRNQLKKTNSQEPTAAEEAF
jgi:membrane protease YdiL (CAAX protease family)